MSDASSSGFAQFVPGFDFLQNLTKSTLPQMSPLGSWIAPTLSVEELDKRIAELKAVHFWLDQNTKALAATVQALEVQKMTLATLKSMNFNMAEVAKAFVPKATGSVAPVPPKTSDSPATPAPAVAEAAASTDQAPADASQPAAGAAMAGLADPMHLWSALTQQFQAIAASAMTEVGKTVAKPARQPVAKATKAAARAPAKRAAAKTPAKKATTTEPPAVARRKR